jgi:hypothetical protein
VLVVNVGGRRGGGSISWWSEKHSEGAAVHLGTN